jgi:DNA-binding response OmpR family regulator
VKKRILVVEDQPHIQTMLRKRLESAGYEVLSATEGAAGLALARTEKPDLMVLDVILPKMSGYQICAALKHDETYREIPILMLTVRSQAGDVERGLALGADAYMIKPYEADAVLTKIAELLEKSGPA